MIVVGSSLNVVETEVVLLEDVAGKQLIAGFLDPSETCEPARVQ